MLPERWSQVKTILSASLERLPAERKAFLEEACQGDPSLRSEVDALLASEAEMESFLEESATGMFSRLEGGISLLEDDPCQIGQTVSHYRILGKVGEGGMGVVYKAQDLKLGRTVALKFLPEFLSRDPHALERFRREARAASALNHPHICTIYDIDEHERRQFISMELLEGRTLRESLGDGPLETTQLLEIGSQIARGLEAAHAKGIIHRDIKPTNIFITRYQQAKLLDFGLAKVAIAPGGVTATVVDSGPTKDPSSEKELTASGVTVGTIAYMSTEQVRGEALDGRSDLFSLGAVLYEMATGQRAFGGATPGLIFDAILNRAPTPLEQLNPSLQTSPI